MEFIFDWKNIHFKKPIYFYSNHWIFLLFFGNRYIISILFINKYIYLKIYMYYIFKEYIYIIEFPFFFRLNLKIILKE